MPRADPFDGLNGSFNGLGGAFNRLNGSLNGLNGASCEQPCGKPIYLPPAPSHLPDIVYYPLHIGSAVFGEWVGGWTEDQPEGIPS